MEVRYPVTELSKKLDKTPQAIHKYCNEKKIETITIKNKSYLPAHSIRSYLESFNFTYPKGIYSFQACKGGVGKTSLCYHIATRAAQYGTKILTIDLDMQAHLTMALLGANHDINFPVWRDILEGTQIESSIIKVHPHIHLIPSNLDNSYLDRMVSQSHKVIYKKYVNDYLEQIKSNYDLIFIDCAPALSHINTAVSLASDKIFIPVNPDLFSFDGLEKTVSELQEIEKSFNKEIDITVILNRFDAREKNSLDVIASLKNKYKTNLCQTVVVVSSEIKNSIARGEFLFDMKKRPQIADDLDAITEEIISFGEFRNA